MRFYLVSKNQIEIIRKHLNDFYFYLGIKVIKLYGWELSFKRIIGDIRSDELKYLKKIGYLNMTTSFLWMCAPLIVAIVSFGTFVLIDEKVGLSFCYL